jgi:hypothetical protein
MLRVIYTRPKPTVARIQAMRGRMDHCRLRQWRRTPRIFCLSEVADRWTISPYVIWAMGARATNVVF